MDVQYGQQHHKNLKLVIVDGSGPCLMGRDWLKVVRLEIGTVSVITADVDSLVAALQERYQ